MARDRSALLANIQVLRGIAALMVALVHQTMFLDVAGFPVIGAGGVDLFFVISGFIMVETTRIVPPSPAKFALNRISRIVPIYWVITLGVYSAAVLEPHLFKATSTSVFELVESFLFIPFFKAGGGIQPVLFVGWTLNYEMFFYLLFTVGLFAKNAAAGRAAIVAALTLCVAAGQVFRFPYAAAVFYSDSIIFEFAFGMLIAEFLTGWQIWLNVPRCLVLICILIVGLVLLAWLPQIFPFLPRVVAMGLPAAAVLISAIALERGGIAVSWRLPIIIGNASYSIYLIHPFVTEGLQRLLHGFATTQTRAWFCIVATLVVTTGVGFLCHIVLEQPLSTWARHRLLPVNS